MLMISSSMFIVNMTGGGDTSDTDLVHQKLFCFQLLTQQHSNPFSCQAAHTHVHVVRPRPYLCVWTCVVCKCWHMTILSTGWRSVWPPGCPVFLPLGSHAHCFKPVSTSSYVCWREVWFIVSWERSYVVSADQYCYLNIFLLYPPHFLSLSSHYPIPLHS